MEMYSRGNNYTPIVLSDWNYGHEYMTLPHTTPVPNIVFDSLIAHFSESELKVFLVIIRKTLGWFDKETGNRKGRDWIANSQFVQFTGLSKVSIWKSIESLSQRHYIQVTDIRGNILSTAKDRHGKHKLFYGIDPLVLNYFHLTPKHFSFDSSKILTHTKSTITK